MRFLEPRPDPGKWKAIALTLLMHALLVAALFFGVRWQNRGPESVEVEVWRSAPAPAVEAVQPPPAPPAPKPLPEPPRKVEPPPPPPAKPDIAIKPDKPEPKKPEPKKPEPKPEAKPEPARPSFEEALKREQAQLDSTRSVMEQQLKSEQEARAAQKAQADAVAAAAAAARARGLADYVGSIKGKIRGNVVLPPTIAGNPEAIFEVVQLPTGEVLNVRLKKSSGNAGLDAAIERAILKSSPLPKPKQPELFQRVLELKYRPVEDL